MAVQNRNTLKSYFNTGDRPAESEFSDFIDSNVHKGEDKAAMAEIQAGTNNAKYVTPAGAKVSVETFAPVKTVNGITPVSGNVSINTGGGSEAGSMEYGIVKYLNLPYGTTDIIHLKLPHKITVHNSMFYLKAEGYNYQAADIIDIVWVGYCHKTGNQLRANKTHVSRSTAITAGQYIGTDDHIYLWFKLPETGYSTFKVDSMKVGNGFQLYSGDVEVIVSTQAQL